MGVVALPSAREPGWLQSPSGKKLHSFRVPGQLEFFPTRLGIGCGLALDLHNTVLELAICDQPETFRESRTPERPRPGQVSNAC